MNSHSVVLPAEPTYDMLKALAGDPLILAASDEQELRRRYQAMIAAAPKSDGPAERDAALEEAAKLCDSRAADQRVEAAQNRSRDYHKVAGELDQQAWGSKYCAEAIRALKNTAPQDRMGESPRDASGNSPASNASSGDLQAAAASEAGADDARDAARYRWLRSRGFAIYEPGGMVKKLTGAVGDAAIDMAAQQDATPEGGKHG